MKKRLPTPHIPAPSEAAKEKARYHAMAAFRNAPREEEEPRASGPNWMRLALFGTGAVACVLAVLLTFTHTPKTSNDSALLTQMQELFGPSLSAIVERDGKIEVLTDPEATTDAVQPVVIEVSQGAEVVRILGFSGRELHIPLKNENLRVDPLITANGDIILVGDDFVIDAASAKFDGATIRARQMEATL